MKKFIGILLALVILFSISFVAFTKFNNVKQKYNDAKYEKFVHNIYLLETVSSYIETIRNQNEPAYGYDATKDAVTFAEGADLVQALHDNGYLDQYYTDNGINKATATDTQKKQAADALEIRPIDIEKYRQNLDEKDKTKIKNLDKYFVITKGDNSGTIVFIDDGENGSKIETTTNFIGITNSEGVEFFGLEISRNLK